MAPFLLLTALLLAAPQMVWAAALSVAPTRVELGPDDRSAVVTLQNDGSEAVMLQVQTFAWPRTPATSDLEPTRDILAVPPVFALAGKGKQIIRVALRGPPPADREQAYRLLITEVPRGGGNDTGVRFALRLSLPVFVTPPGAAPLIGWTIVHTDGSPQLALDNRGTAHLQVRRITLRAPGRSQPLQTIEDGAYLLSGQSITWALTELATAQRTLQLEAETNLGPIQAAIDLPQG